MKVYVSLLLVSVCTAAKLPASFKKCNRNEKNTFYQCLTTAAKDAVMQLSEAKPEVNLPSLTPLEVPALKIGEGKGAVNLVQNYRNVKLHGFTKFDDGKFELDLDSNTGFLEATFPQIRLQADYEINGKVLLLPVYGKGPATIVMEPLYGKIDFQYEQYEKKGKKYLKVVGGKLVLKPGSVTFNFENLFDGDKALGENINKVLNDNWAEVFQDVQENYEEAFGQIIKGLHNNLLAKVPLDELFDS